MEAHPRDARWVIAGGTGTRTYRDLGHTHGCRLLADATSSTTSPSGRRNSIRSVSLRRPRDCSTRSKLFRCEYRRMPKNISTVSLNVYEAVDCKSQPASLPQVILVRPSWKRLRRRPTIWSLSSLRGDMNCLTGSVWHARSSTAQANRSLCNVPGQQGRPTLNGCFAVTLWLKEENCLKNRGLLGPSG